MKSGRATSSEEESVNCLKALEQLLNKSYGYIFSHKPKLACCFVEACEDTFSSITMLS